MASFRRPILSLSARSSSRFATFSFIDNPHCIDTTRTLGSLNFDRCTLSQNVRNTQSSQPARLAVSSASLAHELRSGATDPLADPLALGNMEL